MAAWCIIHFSFTFDYFSYTTRLTFEMQLYDDRATFLLPRPTWVNDSDVASCTSCNNAFGPLNRRVYIFWDYAYILHNLLTQALFFFLSITVEIGRLPNICFAFFFVYWLAYSSGNIFCHDCSNRKVPLPQLGYGTKPVRVCNGCFDVAYLVTYAIDEDHGVSTQVRKYLFFFYYFILTRNDCKRRMALGVYLN